MARSHTTSGRSAGDRSIRRAGSLGQIQTLRIRDAQSVQLISKGWALDLIVDGELVGRRHYIEAATGAMLPNPRAELPTELTLRVGQTCRLSGHGGFDHRLERIEGGRAIFHTIHHNRARRVTRETVAVAPYGLALSLRTDKTDYGRGQTPEIRLTYHNVGASPLVIMVGGTNTGLPRGAEAPLYSLRWLELVQIDARGQVKRRKRMRPVESTMFMGKGYHELVAGSHLTENARLLTRFWEGVDDRQPLEQIDPGRYRLLAEFHSDPLPQATIEAARCFLGQPNQTAERFAEAGIPDISLSTARWLNARAWRLWHGTLQVRSQVFTIEK